MGRGTWQATVHWVTKELDTTEQLTNTSLNRGWDFFFFLTINGKNFKYQCITKNKGIVTHLAENKSRSGLKSWEAFDCKQFFSPFLGGSVVKNPAANAGDVGSIPASGKSLEKVMATHSNILAWRIPCIEKPDRLQSMGCKRVRYYLVTKQATHSPYKP